MSLRPKLLWTHVQCEVCPSPWRSGRPLKTAGKATISQAAGRTCLSKAGGVSLVLGPPNPCAARYMDNHRKKLFYEAQAAGDYFYTRLAVSS